MNDPKKHYATLKTTDQRYRVFYQDRLLLESNKTVQLAEFYGGKEYPAVIYFPPAPLAELDLVQTDLKTTCPIKGEACY